MKVVELTNGKIAIPVHTTTFLHFDRMVGIVADLIYHGRLTFESRKSDIMKEVRSHLYMQGISVYGDWYEDTDATPIINESYPDVEKLVKKQFPEICQ